MMASTVVLRSLGWVWMTLTLVKGQSTDKPIIRQSLQEDFGHASIQEALDIIDTTQTTDMQKSSAWLDVGKLYLYGNDSTVGKNPDKAMRCLNASATLGNPEAQALMGLAHHYGIWGSMTKDNARAMLNYYFAAVNGDIGATMTLAHKHRHGYGAPKSCETSLLYYEVAAKKAIELRHGEAVTKIAYDQRPPRFSAIVDQKNTGPKDADVVDYYHYVAEKGDPDALLSLGSLYYYGARSVEQDLEKAADFFHKAYDMGAPTAATNLGHIYAHGYGVVQNNETAFGYYKEASKDDIPAGQNGLGYLYLKGYVGQDDPENLEKGLNLIKASAKKGHAEALYNLGVYYMEPGLDGEDPNYVLALQHFAAAAQHSHTDAIYRLGQMYMHGTGAPRSCEHAIEQFKLVAERGPWSEDLRTSLAQFRSKHYHAAFVTNLIFAERGVEVAQENAAWMMDNRYVDTALGEVTIRLYKSAAAQGNVEANVKIGDYYFVGRDGVEVDAVRAAAYYRKAAKKHIAQAMFNLGYMHEHGIGLPQDFLLAKRWYDQATDTSEEAKIPIMLALWKLRLHVYLKSLVEDHQTARTSGLEEPDRARPDRRDGTKASSGETQPTQDSSSVTSNDDILERQRVQGDVVLMVVLFSILLVVLVYRAKRQHNHVD